MSFARAGGLGLHPNRVLPPLTSDHWTRTAKFVWSLKKPQMREFFEKHLADAEGTITISHLLCPFSPAQTTEKVGREVHSGKEAGTWLSV